MTKLLSTVRLKDDMVKALEEKYPNIDYVYKSPEDLSQTDKASAEIFNTYGNKFGLDDVENFKSLKWINVMSAGVNNLPLDQLKNIHITNAKGIHKIQMTEFTIGLILAYYKDLHQLKENEHNNYWDSDAKSSEIYGKTAHILGTGSIGTRIAEVLNIFGVTVVGYNTSGKNVTGFSKTYAIDERNKHINEADIVISILPSTEKTKALLDIDFFKRMKNSGIFINIGRGDVMTDETVLTVLKEEMIAHMMLDVFNEEPLPNHHPFYALDHLTITPHASSKTAQYLERAFEQLMENLEYVNEPHKMINIIDHDSGY